MVKFIHQSTIILFQQALNNIDIDIGQILLVAGCTSHNLLHIVTKLLPPYFIALNLMVYAERSTFSGLVTFHPLPSFYKTFMHHGEIIERSE